MYFYKKLSFKCLKDNTKLKHEPIREQLYTIINQTIRYIYKFEHLILYSYILFTRLFPFIDRPDYVLQF